MRSPIDKQKKVLEFKGQAQMFVFGIQDGLISILGLMAGVFGALDNRSTMIITGLAGAIAAALSMGTGALLGTEAERDLLSAELQSIKSTLNDTYYYAQDGIMKELVGMGLKKSDAFKIVKLLSQEDETFFSQYRSLVLELPNVEEISPIKDAIVMFIAFILGAFFPIFPYTVIDGVWAYYTSIAVTSFILFLLGYIKGYLSKQNALLSGLKFFTIAVGSGIISEFIGGILGTIIS